MVEKEEGELKKRIKEVGLRTHEDKKSALLSALTTFDLDEILDEAKKEFPTATAHTDNFGVYSWFKKWFGQ